MLASAAAPMLGLVDTAIIGRYGSASDLAGLAVVVALFNFIFWGFGFLRMGTTGLVAQVQDDVRGISSVFCRNLALALLLALALIASQTLILHAANSFYQPPQQSRDEIAAYFSIRIWGAPASLCFYIVAGILIGMGKSKLILALALALNISNALLDFLFAYGLGMGLQGIALGTILAEYLCLAIPMTYLSRHCIDLNYIRSQLGSLFSWAETLAQLKLNRDILIRTFFLLLAFSWFTRLGAQHGETQLAANHILLQFISLSAFFLDGFAHVLEAKAGRYFARKDRAQFVKACLRTTQLCAATAAVIALCLLVFGAEAIKALNDQFEVSRQAQVILPLACVYIAFSFFAFQLDGLFIGLAKGPALRNASIVSSLIFVLFSWWLSDAAGIQGLWWAFIGYVLIRAISLGYYIPTLMRDFQ